jgi:SAM-dependent methyltransferase
MGEIIPRPTPPTPLPFTGERLTSEYCGQTQIEHLHRYLLVREWCRDKDVLDVASGEGYGTALIAQVARSAVGVEIASDAVAHATNSYIGENLCFIQGDARVLPLGDASCDVVVSFETIEHFAEQQRFLKEARRVLRPNGMLVVSTPDRDNYSPPDTPANPYHVKELSGAEFEALLRSHFAEVSILLQRPIFGSVLLPTVAEAVAPLCFERRGAGHFEASVGLARPQYLIAFASDVPAAALPSSVYIDTGRLGMLNPIEAASLLNNTQAACVAERTKAEAAEAENAQLSHKANTLRDRVAAAAADLEACRFELAAARGEAKGLLMANEMAEQACSALRSELFSTRQALLSARTDGAESSHRARQLEAQLANTEAQLANTEVQRENTKAQLANTLASHSWRVTAPLRQISRTLYQRP